MTKNKDIENKRIAVFQRDLKDIMELFNITCEELGDKIGVSRTQICNIRSGVSKMTKAQYIAIRVVLSESEDVIRDRFKVKIQEKKNETLTKVQVLEESQ